MSPETLKELKIKLEEEKSRIKKGLESFAVKDPVVKDDWDAKFPSFGDHRSEQDENADEVDEYEVELAAEHSLELSLKDINIALEKMENGAYGICEKCQKEMPVERLMANPEAKNCVQC